MDRLRQMFSSEEEDEQAILLDSGQILPSLSYATRVKFFAIFFVLGVLLTILSNLFFLLPGSGISIFALLYSLGNVCALLSTFFLMGPVNQCKRMFAKSRIIAASFVLVSCLLRSSV
uniref:Vesicle transport protein n=1 Tax=Mesocestoides corti TaxID=53468 RepID=A0A5K3EYY5_MESCO